MLYLGCVVGVTAGAAVARADGLNEARFALAAIVLLVPALVGARLWFVIQHFELFRAQPRRMFGRGEGGSALYGGLILGVATSLPVLAVARLPFWGFWDAASVTMLVGMIIARFGCLMHGCCAGRTTSGPLGVWLPNDRGEWRHRFPTQLLEAGWSAAVLVLALAARSHLSFQGALFAAVVAGYAAGRLVLELTRESANPKRTIYVNVAFSGMLLIAACTALIYGWRR
jgi:phosphatidylglycerol:prolipoprotein diacylglycerol transferase